MSGLNTEDILTSLRALVKDQSDFVMKLQQEKASENDIQIALKELAVLEQSLAEKDLKSAPAADTEGERILDLMKNYVKKHNTCDTKINKLSERNDELSRENHELRKQSEEILKFIRSHELLLKELKSKTDSLELGAVASKVFLESVEHHAYQFNIAADQYKRETTKARDH